MFLNMKDGSHSTNFQTVLFSKYRVSIKSLYNFKNLLQRQLMRYLHQISSMYSVVIKVFITLHFRLMNKTLLNEQNGYSSKRRDSVYHGLLKPNRIYRLSETSELSIEEIHSLVHQFVHDTRNLWRQR